MKVRAVSLDKLILVMRAGMYEGCFRVGDIVSKSRGAVELGGISSGVEICGS